MSNCIKKILMSEKSFTEAGKGKFTFIVDPKTTKEGAAILIKKLFDIEVISINSMNYQGKIKNSKKSRGKRNNFKKMIVTGKPGSRIELFEAETTREEKAKKEKPTKKVEENKDVKVTIKKK